jgi:hypothetical protein
MDIGFTEIVVAAVILSRLIVPLFIPRFPLPAIIASLLIDGIDQTVFQVLLPDADLSNYQSYDKALDIYYLVIAFITTMRNWTNQVAVYIARFLIFYRLVGVVLFELSGIRELLFIFPNTFEYFFIFYEAVRLFWDPRRMTPRVLVGATAFIWIFIKLPQEWWIHVAQLDTTDFIQETIFGVDPSTGWIDTFAARPWIVVIAIVAAAIAAWVLWWLARHYLPPRDRPLTIDADAEPGRAVPPERLAAERRRMMERILRPDLWEKYALISLVTIIFGQMLGLRSDPIELAFILGIVVIANAALSTAFARRGFGPTTAIMQFIVTGLLNVAILAVVLFVLTGFDDVGPLLRRLGFLLLLVTLLITLYDRYRPEYVARFTQAGPEIPPDPSPASDARG